MKYLSAITRKMAGYRRVETVEARTGLDTCASSLRLEAEQCMGVKYGIRSQVRIRTVYRQEQDHTGS